MKPGTKLGFTAPRAGADGPLAAPGFATAIGRGARLCSAVPAICTRRP